MAHLFWIRFQEAYVSYGEQDIEATSNDASFGRITSLCPSFLGL